MQNPRESSSRRNRRQSPETLESRLKSYTLVAGAAGVGLLALAPPAQADIIAVTESPPVVIGPSFTVNINGHPVLSFKHTFSGSGVRLLIVGGSFLRSYPFSGITRPPKGAPISTRQRFTGFENTFFGSWGVGYFGFEFSSGAGEHFGWAKLSVTQTAPFPIGKVTGRLFEYAYQTTPNVAIRAGQTVVPEPPTATLTLLALGAAGLACWRKRRKAEAA